MRFQLVEQECVDVRTEAMARDLAAQLVDCQVLAVDTETTGVNDYMDQHVLWASFYAGGDTAWAVPIEWLGQLKPILEKAGPEGPRTLIMHNAKYDGHMLANHDINVFPSFGGENVVHDTMVMSWLYDSSTPNDLKWLASTLLGMDLIGFEKMFGKATKKDPRLPIEKAPRESVVRYACLDAISTFMLWKKLRLELDNMDFRRGTGWDHFCDVEAPYTDVLFEMERIGTPLDKHYLETIREQAQEDRDALREKLIRLAGRADFNPGSNAQLGEYLFKQKKIAPIKLTATGKPSTDKTTMELLAKRGVPEAALVLKLRSTEKMLGTYIEPLLILAKKYGRVHCRFNQTGAETGRLSSADPNLQNIPIRSDGYAIRRAFAAEPGRVLLDLDYDQLEVVLAACISRDPTLSQAIVDGKDIHAATTARIYNIEYDTILAAKRADDAGDPLTPRQRDLLRKRANTKTVVFCTLYGGGRLRVAQQTGMSEDEAAVLIDTFFLAFPRLKQAIRRAVADAREYGYVSTFLGRRRYFPDIASDDDALRAAEERRAFNCVDFETEALTKDGWVYGPDLNEGTEILTKNPVSGWLEWQPVRQMTVVPDYSGPLVRFQSTTFDAVTTPDHRWLVYDKWHKKDLCKRTCDLSVHGDHRIHRTGAPVGPTAPEFTDDFVRLAGWVLTDGTYKKGSPGVTVITISQSQRANPNNVAEIRQTLGSLGAHVSEHYSKWSHVWMFNFSGDLARQVRVLFPDRVLSVGFVDRLTVPQRLLLLETMLKGDGSRSKRGGPILVARNPEACGAFQALCVLCGKATNAARVVPDGKGRSSDKTPNVIVAKKPYWRIRVLDRHRAQVLKHHVSTTHGGGVWCPSVPNTYFVARRRGKVFVTGNCIPQGGSADVMRLAMLQCSRDPVLRELGVKMHVQVHDELLFSMPANADLEKIKEAILTNMTDLKDLRLPLPLRVSGRFAQNWLEAH